MIAEFVPYKFEMRASAGVFSTNVRIDLNSLIYLLTLKIFKICQRKARFFVNFKSSQGTIFTLFGTFFVVQNRISGTAPLFS